MNVGLSVISQAYAAAKSLRISDLLIDYEDLSRYSSALRKVEYARDEGSLGLINRHVDCLKALYWSLLSNLLPYCVLSDLVLKEGDAIIHALERESVRNGRLTQACAIVIACVHSFRSRTDNPLANVLAQEIATCPVQGAKCIILSDSRYLETTRIFVNSDPAYAGCEVCAPGSLRDLHFYEQIYLVGSPRRFERDKWLLTSPRAPRIVSVRFSWLQGFPDWQTPFLQSASSAVTQEAAAIVNTPAVFIEGTVDIPDVNWEEAQRLSDVEIQKDVSTEHEDDVPARLHALPNDYFVFLSAEADARVLSLDLDRLGVDDEDDAVIYRVNISSLTPGDYIVLRTEGGKDAIVEQANLILGRSAPYLRDGLNSWKSSLRKLVLDHGATEIGARLEHYGAQTSPKVNVKNWCSRETIKPQSFEDFASIMKLLGREDEAVQEWGNAHRVLTAHREAGHRIRRALIAAVERADLSMLKETGVQIFELAGSGSMTAYRIGNVAPSAKRIPVSSLNRVMRLPTS